MTDRFDANKLGTAKAMRATGAVAEKFNSEKQTAIGKGAVDVVSVQKENATSARRLSEIKGYAFYTLGPIYAATRIGFDIVGNYGNLVGFKGPRIIVQLRGQLFDGLGPWSTALEGMPIEHVMGLKRFMASQTAMMVDIKTYWRFEETTIVCPDPLGIDRLDIRGPDDVASITVFLPSGNKARYAVKTPTTPPIGFAVAQPRSAILVEARAAFESREKQGIGAA